ncbi:MAG: hypothetical protein HYV28_09460 [Ignavibacteriales bacterium]|nr:hypothetical protein [Ignavibacteriales bacterium]
MYHVVTFTGPFGFIKPWTAVRDSETFSQQFLTPSIVQGIEMKLFPELLEDMESGIKKIARHRLSYDAVSAQTETTQSKAYELFPSKKIATRKTAIATRGTLVNPVLHLAFTSAEDAAHAATQHICLCRNEDVLFPDKTVRELNVEAFELIDGFELLFGSGPESFMVGYNRFAGITPMHGKIIIQGSPLKTEYTE